MQSFWRIVTSPELTRDDFLTSEEAGVPMPQSEEGQRIWRGRSVFATETQARNQASHYPYLGQWLARIDLPENSGILSERTTRTRGHYTLFGSTDAVHHAARHTNVIVPVGQPKE